MGRTFKRSYKKGKSPFEVHNKPHKGKRRVFLKKYKLGETPYELHDAEKKRRKKK